MTAVKLRIKDLVEGTYDGKSVSTLFGEVSEARILGTLIDMYVTDDENYMALTLDDGTETVRIKAWRQDVEKLKKFSKGDFIDVVGKVREYNEEIYLTPEVVSKVSSNKWVLRELELMRLYLQSGGAVHEVEEGEPDSEEFEGKIEEEPEVSGTAGTERIEKPEREKKEEDFEEELDLEDVEEFEVLGEDEVVETVLDLLREGMTKEMLIEKSGLDEIDVELALRELLDEGKIKKEGNNYRKMNE
jgi:RPA family protein